MKIVLLCRFYNVEEYFYDKPLFHSMFCTDLMESLTDVRYYINDYRMFQDTKVTEIPLKLSYTFDNVLIVS